MTETESKPSAKSDATPATPSTSKPEPQQDTTPDATEKTEKTEKTPTEENPFLKGMKHAFPLERPKAVITQLTKAFGTVFLHNLATTKSGEPVTIVAERRVINRALDLATTLPSLALSTPEDPNGPEKWEKDPISIDVTCESFDGCLGQGRAGTVLPALASESSTTPEGTETVNASFEKRVHTLGAIPPFAIKVARKARGSLGPGWTRLAQEGWLYNRMDALQGSVVARCYGYYHAQLNGDWVIPKWLEADETWLMGPEEGVRTSEEKTPTPQEKKRSISFLLLERLGDRVSPEGKAVGMDGKSVVTADWTEIADLYKDLAKIGIQHAPQDIRASNILRAPYSPPGLPGERSPYTRRKYGWRLINFDGSDVYRGRGSSMAPSVISSIARTRSGKGSRITASNSDADTGTDGGGPPASTSPSSTPASSVSDLELAISTVRAEKLEDLKEYYTGSLDILLHDVMAEPPGLYTGGRKRVRVVFNLDRRVRVKREPSD